jgi:predicted HTH transcriptional regulator
MEKIITAARLDNYQIETWAVGDFFGTYDSAFSNLQLRYLIKLSCTAIHSLMQDYPELVMEIDDESSFVQVRFIKNYFSQEAAQETAETAQENTKKMVLELLRQNPKYTKSDLMRVLAKADGTIKEHIANLKKEGMLKRVGGTKSGHWVFTDE